ncbi:Demethylmenaquinone methyltransferase [Sporomusa ovata DSM 2662]|uniref:2-heptaprenyl-1,4-naphthoquinone methyltransferase n=1 Tax=Sporomusa ovata TaxID=2378 RepID=A0A0U1L299_9FIRM|nr:class I SAM-dependent methyltransferase [Sporomusa ovata]EQB27194.1 methylase involved in ubiquinone/menaquinone biosynthesis [Sporomusa ovata DSM 2662]CQR73034.1 2-heptaprenyl-1,4-naphthoquinone methyltransferase [Sporomusa ovata]
MSNGTTSRVDYSFQHKKCVRRPSSFDMHDSKQVFSELSINEGDIFLDMGCGAGDYTKRASQSVGDSGLVYAMDIREDMIESLRAEVNSQGFRNIKTIVADITAPLPIESQSIDICLLSTVLHAVEMDNRRTIFSELHRILKYGGRVAIIECKKEDMPFGPPKHMRLSPEEVERAMTQYGFEMINLVDLGYNYMIQCSAK